MVVAHLLGFPLEDADQFRVWIRSALEDVGEAREQREADQLALADYINKHIDQRIENPGEDLISYLLAAEMEGEKLSREHVFGTVALALIAGIDTTWSALGSSLLHLANNAVDRRRLVENPSMIAQAIEEFLRAYAPVTMARVVTEDMEFHGVQMKKEDWVLLPFPAANRDENEFPNAATVDIDREINRHTAFGLGIHRCIGSNLARLELNVAIEVFLERFPDFEQDSKEEVKWSLGQVRGPRKLPLRIMTRS
jgi:cytochrome P450